MHERTRTTTSRRSTTARLLYNHTNPLVTHASIQNGSAVEDVGRAVLYRDVYRKPIVFDEVKYEGDIPQRWGNLSAEEMVHRFWQGTIAGTYVGHGETYLHPNDVLWWSKGGVLRGQSPPRIAFLREMLETAPAEGVEPIDKWQEPEHRRQDGRVLPGLLSATSRPGSGSSSCRAASGRRQRTGRRDAVSRRRARYVEHDDHADRQAVHAPSAG